MRLGSPRYARALFAEPAVTDVGVSPRGDRVSYVRHGRLADVIVMREVGGGAERTVTTSAWPIVAHAWLADGTAIVYVVADGRARRERAIAIDVTSRERAEVGPVGAAELYLVDPGEPRLLGPLLAVRDGDGLPLLYRLNGARGPAVPVDVDRVVARWFLDPSDRIRAGTRLADDGTLSVYACDGSGWAEVARFGPPASLSTQPLDVSAAGDRLILVGPADGGRMGLLGVDLGSGEMRTLIVDPAHDLDYAQLDVETRTPQLLVYSGARPLYRAADETIEADLAGLRRHHPGDPHVIARSRDDQTWVARLDAPDAPPAYVAWHRPSASGQALGDPHPRLRRRTLAGCAPVTLRARDGVELNGYLTRPLRARRDPPPLVLLVHGGPWARDSWEFVPEVQWLADRGYACLQVNFRGSEGGGPAFLDLADRDWGGAPQDDLDDAVSWAVGAGYADPARMAIMGRSYGGYAALMAATARPKRFACAVAVSAPTDLVAFVAHVRASRLPTRAVFVHRIGDPERDRDLLWQRSPLGHAHACHTPILLAHGRLDALVPVGQAERLAAALGRAGWPARTVVFADEGHGVDGARSRVRLARAVAAFLGAHLCR